MPRLFFCLHSNPGHNLGRYRTSVTASDRSTFRRRGSRDKSDADGSATWVALTPDSAVSSNGQTLTTQGHGSNLASGTQRDSLRTLFRNPTPEIPVVFEQLRYLSVAG